MRGFPRDLLTSGEQVILELRPHFKALVKPVLAILLAIAAVVAAFVTFDDVPRLIVIGVAVLLIVAYAVPALLKWKFTLFVVTNERLITRSGVVAKHSKEIPLEVINDVTFTQSLLDRILGSGNLVVESAGERGQSTFKDVRKPEAVQKRIYELAELRKGLGRPDSVADELAKLADLRDRGVLSADEFEDRKRRLLS